MHDMNPTTCLYPGHKPLSVMLDERDNASFEKVKANKDRPTLKVEIFKTFPVI